MVYAQTILNIKASYLTPNEQFISYIKAWLSSIQWKYNDEDDVSFVLDQHSYLNL